MKKLTQDVMETYKQQVEMITSLDGGANELECY